MDGLTLQSDGDGVASDATPSICTSVGTAMYIF